MVSLASYRTVLITAIALVDGGEDLRSIAGVRFEGDYGGPEESSAEDFIRWLDRVEGRAYVRQPDGTRGLQVHVVDGESQRYLRSDPHAETDPLLFLPRLRPVTPVHRVPTHRRGGSRTRSLR